MFVVSWLELQLSSQASWCKFFIPVTWEAEAGESRGQGLSVLQIEFIPALAT